MILLLKIFRFTQSHTQLRRKTKQKVIKKTTKKYVRKIYSWKKKKFVNPSRIRNNRNNLLNYEEKAVQKSLTISIVKNRLNQHHTRSIILFILIEVTSVVHFQKKKQTTVVLPYNEVVHRFTLYHYFQFPNNVCSQGQADEGSNLP